jgi:hypothetical protein
VNKERQFLVNELKEKENKLKRIEAELQANDQHRLTIDIQRLTDEIGVCYLLYIIYIYTHVCAFDKHLQHN